MRILFSLIILVLIYFGVRSALILFLKEDVKQVPKYEKQNLEDDRKPWK